MAKFRFAKLIIQQNFAKYEKFLAKLLQIISRNVDLTKIARIFFAKLSIQQNLANFSFAKLIIRRNFAKYEKYLQNLAKFRQNHVEKNVFDEISLARLIMQQNFAKFRQTHSVKLNFNFV